MDPYVHAVLGKGAPEHWEALRLGLGQTRRLAGRVDLAAMAPHDDLASTRYCLSRPGVAYIVYLPEGGEVDLDLSGASGAFRVEWTHPIEGTATRAGGRRHAEDLEGGAPRAGRPVPPEVLMPGAQRA